MVTNKDPAAKRKAQPSSPAKAPQRHVTKQQEAAPVAPPKPATLQDLCPEDKQKVANLLKQVVDLGQEVHKLQTAQEESAQTHQEVDRLKQANHELVLENVNMKAKIAQMLLLLKAYKRKVHDLSSQAAAAAVQHQAPSQPPAPPATAPPPASSTAASAPPNQQHTTPDAGQATQTATTPDIPASQPPLPTSNTTTSQEPPATCTPAIIPAESQERTPHIRDLVPHVPSPLLSIPPGAHVSITIQHQCTSHTAGGGTGAAAGGDVEAGPTSINSLPPAACTSQPHLTAPSPQEAEQDQNRSAAAAAAAPTTSTTVQGHTAAASTAAPPVLAPAPPHQPGTASHTHVGTVPPACQAPACSVRPEDEPSIGAAIGSISASSSSSSSSSSIGAAAEQPGVLPSSSSSAAAAATAAASAPHGRSVVVAPEQLAAASTQAVEVVDIQGDAGGDQGPAAASPLLVTPGGVGSAAAASLMHWQMKQGLMPQEELLAGGAGRVLRYDPSIGSHGAFFFTDLPVPAHQHTLHGVAAARLGKAYEAEAFTGGADPLLLLPSSHHTLEQLNRSGDEGEAGCLTPVNLHSRLDISDPGRDELDELTDTLSELGSELTLSSSVPGTPLVHTHSLRAHLAAGGGGAGQPAVHAAGRSHHEGSARGLEELHTSLQRLTRAAAEVGRESGLGRLGQQQQPYEHRQAGRRHGAGAHASSRVGSGGLQQGSGVGSARGHVDQDHALRQQQHHAHHVVRAGSQGVPYSIPGTRHLVMPVSSNDTHTVSYESREPRARAQERMPGSAASVTHAARVRHGSSSGHAWEQEQEVVSSRWQSRGTHQPLREQLPDGTRVHDASRMDQQWQGQAQGHRAAGARRHGSTAHQAAAGQASREVEEAASAYDESLMDFVMEVESRLMQVDADSRSKVQPRVVRAPGLNHGLAKHSQQLDMHSVALRAALAAVQQSQQVV